MIKIILFIFICLKTNEAISIPIVGFGQCPRLETVHNFQLNKYVGLWYEIARYKFTIFELNGDCVTATYTPINDTTIKVENKMIKLITNTKSEIVGTAYPADNSGDAKLKVNFPTAFGRTSNYWVLGTDYENWAVVWSCEEFLNDVLALGHFNLSWILSRHPTLDENSNKAVQEIMAKNNLNIQNYRFTEQSTCPGKK